MQSFKTFANLWDEKRQKMVSFDENELNQEIEKLK